jgi:hypothetical protein
MLAVVTIKDKISLQKFKTRNLKSAEKLLLIISDNIPFRYSVPIIEYISKHPELYPSLRKISIDSGNIVSTDDFGSLAGINGLEHLDVNINGEMAHLSGIEKISNLKTLRISCCSVLDIAGIEYLGNLRSLALSGRDYKNMELLNLIPKLKGLRIAGGRKKILDLSGSKSLKELAVDEISYLKIKFCPAARPVRIEFIGRDLPPKSFRKIEGLNPSNLLYFFGKNSKFNNLDFLEGARKLKILSVCDNPSLTSIPALESRDMIHVCFDNCNRDTLINTFPPQSLIEFAFFSLYENKKRTCYKCYQIEEDKQYISHLLSFDEDEESEDYEDEEEV